MKALEKLIFELQGLMLIKNLHCLITNILINHQSQRILDRNLPAHWIAKIEDSLMLIQGTFNSHLLILKVVHCMRSSKFN